MISKAIFPVGWALALLAAPVSSGAQTVFDIVPGKDNSIYEESPQNSNGIGELFTGLTAEGFERRALLTFSPGAIPPGSIVRSADLTVTLSRTRPGDVRFGLHGVLADWGEADSLAGGQGGAGAPAATGDATWSHRFFPDLAWQSRGGDFAPELLSETVIGTALTDYTFPTTPAFVQLVQRWLDDAGTNFGLIIIQRPDSPGTAKRLHSRESTFSPPVLSLGVLTGERLFRSGFEG